MHFLDETRKFEPKHDDKLQKLIRLLKSKELAGQKVLIFTEFADTARYLKRQLDEAGIDGVAQVDSATKGNRADVIQRFSPYYNGTSSADARGEGPHGDPRPDLDRRPLRRPEPPGRLADDQLRHPLEPGAPDAAHRPRRPAHEPGGREAARRRPPGGRGVAGKVSFWNFLPPDELNAILTLYTKVTQKTLLISKTLGIEGKKLLTPEDDYEALKEFNHAYEGTKTAVEDMHLEYQALLQADPELGGAPQAAARRDLQRPQAPGQGRARRLLLLRAPRARQGGRRVHRGGRHDPLVSLRPRPRRDPRGARRDRRQHPLQARHAAHLHRPRRRLSSSSAATVEKHIKNTYLKRVDAPVGVKPALKCWMELNEG